MQYDPFLSSLSVESYVNVIVIVLNLPHLSEMLSISWFQILFYIIS